MPVRPLMVTLLALLAGCLGDPSARDAGVVDDAAVIDAALPDATLADARADAGSCVSGVANTTRTMVRENASGFLELSAPTGPGQVLSEVVDFGEPRTLRQLSWDPVRPVLKPLPGAVVESGYRLGGLDLSELRLLLRFDERVASTTLADSSGQNNTARCTMTAGGPDRCPLPTPGRFHYATQFPTARRLTVTDATSLRPVHFTVASWVRIAPPNGGAGHHEGNRGAIVTKGRNETAPFSAWGLEHTDTDDAVVADRNALRCYATINNGTMVAGYALDARMLLRDDQSGWFHVACTYDGSTLALYVDGQLGDMRMISGTIDYGQAITSLSVGSFGGNSQYFRGDLDELMVLGRALSASDVRELYLRGALSLRLQVRACDDGACLGEGWQGPDGSDTTWFSELCGSSAGLPTLDLHRADCDRDGIPDNGGLDLFAARPFYQWRAELTSPAAPHTPYLADVTLCP